MNIRQRLFNSSPTPNATAIIGKEGQKYWADRKDIEVTSKIYLWHRGKRIAHVYLEWRNPDLVLVDIVSNKPNYRDHDICISLLQNIICLAQKQGAGSILGLIARHDLETDHYLANWYQ